MLKIAQVVKKMGRSENGKYAKHEDFVFIWIGICQSKVLPVLAVLSELVFHPYLL